jgi:hypothetical protein
LRPIVGFAEPSGETSLENLFRLSNHIASGRRLLAVSRESPTLRLCRHDLRAAGIDLPSLCCRVPGIHPDSAPGWLERPQGMLAVKTRAGQVRKHSSSPNQFDYREANIVNARSIHRVAIVPPNLNHSTRQTSPPKCLAVVRECWQALADFEEWQGHLIRCSLTTFFLSVGLGSGSSRSLQTFPKDLVVEFGRNAVFLGKVEAAGFLRPVLRVMSRL